MTYLSFIIIYCIQRLNGERSISNIFHLLQGKKSSQTIQDAHLYKLAFLFQTVKNISREELDKNIKLLLQRNMIEKCTEDTYRITEEGTAFIVNYSKKFPFPKHVDGLTYSSLTEQFWQRFALLVQTLSYLVFNETTYIPVSKDEDVLKWTKAYLTSLKEDRKTVSQHLYRECIDLLREVDERDANIFVSRLSGIQRAGMTSEQSAAFFNLDLIYTHLIHQSVIHFILKRTSEQPNRYPYLYNLAKDLYQSYPLTDSTRRTYEYIVNGASIDEIVSMRQLKKSTIEDHVVELTLHIPTFSIRPFVSENREKTILETINTLQTNRLKHLKEAIVEDVTYFQIRLVLAKKKGR